ncbi:hypothetical protein PLICRDRAFT_103181 [Plicaturopsis crispa FD-325 SS-3]|nr:hypothetical protein PLICRDRAFT_103181 [Plicaturopsis crispa FD-325 SS-3]
MAVDPARAASEPIAIADDIPNSPGHFNGDFFGEHYEDGDFDGDIPDLASDTSDDEYCENSDSDSDSSESDEDVEYDEEPCADPDSRDNIAEASSAQERNRLAEHRAAVEERYLSPPHVQEFPGRAGERLQTAKEDSGYHKYKDWLGDDCMWAPFASRLEWEVARWAKTRGPGSTAFTELLSIEGVQEKLGLSFANTKQLNKIIDNDLPKRPRFHPRSIKVAGETYDVYFRDVLECVKALYGDPEFARHLVFAPERHYTDADRTVRMFHDMHTGKWWWETQKAVEARTPGATIAPIIISSDKTQITLFRNKTAYPVYMTIGNIPKDIRRKPSRRAYVLLGYLPTSRLEHITNKESRRRTLANLFHACMRRILHPLKIPGQSGIPMSSGDGVVRRVHPIFAAFVGDYPEQVLVTGVKNGDCPKCEIARPDRGDGDAEFEFRDLERVLDALQQFDDDNFENICKEAGVKPLFHPFWEDLPYVDIYRSITPDVLHQLYQGVIKHLIEWVTKAVGPDEVDARCQRLPPNHNIRLFMKGITGLSRVTGEEHNQMCRFLMALVVDVRLPGGPNARARLVQAVRALLDFLYLACYPRHTTETLDLLDDALQRFHANKDIFVDLGIREDFNIPKLHFLRHYVLCIKMFGTTDNYNTEYTERLHIDLAKDAYRATNHKDEYPQMALWLERKEKVLQHDRFIRWRLAGCPDNDSWRPPDIEYRLHLKMARTPSVDAVPFESLENDYKATYFQDAFARYLVQFKNPDFTNAQIEAAARNTCLPFQKVAVYHKVKFWNQDALGHEGTTFSDTLDTIHVRPMRQNARGKLVPGRFDTALVNDGTGGRTGVKGYRVMQVRAVFSLSKAALDRMFPDPSEPRPPKHLAYVEWFTPFSVNPEPHYGMYKVKRVVRDGQRIASIIPVSRIRRSVHLFPKWGPVAPREWKSSSVLDDAPAFLVNCWLDRHSYITLY